jgi:hypothetical protein
MTEMEANMPGESHNHWKENIEADVRNMGERLAGVEAGIRSLGQNFDRFSHAFETSTARQSELQKTQWPVVFGVLGLVAVVAGGFLSGYLRDLNRVESNVTAIQNHRTSEADAPQNARLEFLTDKMREVDKRDGETAQALSKHTSDGHPRRVEEQIIELRRDMTHIANELDAVMLANPRQDEMLRALHQQAEHVRSDREADLTRDASVIERIRALERRVFDQAGGGIHDAETHHGEER